MREAMLDTGVVAEEGMRGLREPCGSARDAEAMGERSASKAAKPAWEPEV